jgi:RNA polymerase sigma-70 factor (ECF subfamily)
MFKQEVTGGPLYQVPTKQRESLVKPTADTTLVTALFEQYHEAIFAYLYRMLNDRETAHDLTQETFLQVFRTRDRLAGVENKRAWLYRIATNLALNAIKRRQRFTWLPWRKVDEGNDLNQPDPTKQVGQDLLVKQVLRQLPPDYRAPLLLYSHDGFSVREVAEALNLSEGAVKTRLHRAREMFRRLYNQEDDQ